MGRCWSCACKGKSSTESGRPSGCGRRSNRDRQWLLVDGRLRGLRVAVLRVCVPGARVEPLGRAPLSRGGALAGGARAGNGGGGGIMTPRRKRLLVVLGILCGVAASVSLAVMASRENIMFYYDPSQVVQGKAPLAKRFRIGGVVGQRHVARHPRELPSCLRPNHLPRPGPVGN